jgi:hypothetical protein
MRMARFVDRNLQTPFRRLGPLVLQFVGYQNRIRVALVLIERGNVKLVKGLS